MIFYYKKTIDIRHKKALEGLFKGTPKLFILFPLDFCTDMFKMIYLILEGLRLNGNSWIIVKNSGLVPSRVPNYN